MFAVDATLGSGYAQQWNVAVQRELTSNLTLEAAYVGSHIVHVGIPDTNLNQLTVDQLAAGRAAAHARDELALRHHPALVVARRPDDQCGPADKAVPAIHDGEPLSQQRRDDAVRRLRDRGCASGCTRGLLYSVAYTRSKLMDDASSVFDASILTGPLANYPVADSFNRTLERDYSTGDIPHVFVSSVVWDLPFGAGRAHQLAEDGSAPSPTTGR